MVNHRANVNEIAAASVVYVRGVRADQPTPNWNHVDSLRHFSVVRRLDGKGRGHTTTCPPPFSSQLFSLHTLEGDHLVGVYRCAQRGVSFG